MHKLRNAVLALVAMVATQQAMAFDATGATTYISGGMTTGLTDIGLAILAVAALAVGFKWAKGMLFS